MEKETTKYEIIHNEDEERIDVKRLSDGMIFEDVEFSNGAIYCKGKGICLFEDIKDEQHKF